MKLLLDEMYTAVVAEQLRARDRDVIAVAERADLRGTPDEDLLDWALSEDRARTQPLLHPLAAVATIGQA